MGAEPLPAVAWRLVGPFRGGWSTMAVGVPALPDTYYMGTAGGGVWKTTDSGRTWRPVSDGAPITAVGALAVAPSDPAVVYVGTGQADPRYDIGAGSGVYRSRDAGASWESAGLQDTRHIGALLVDRRDANVVLVAALGHVFGPGGERGVYRSADGGRSWTRTLYVDEQTGAVDLAVDPVDPDLVYATTWTARVWPWLSYFTAIEGPGSAIYRSQDGGRNWQKLGGAGWPAGDLGRIGLAVTRAAGATRIYATVASEHVGGLYRSDDAGGHWTRVHDAGWATSWYVSRLTVSPVDPEDVFLPGQSIHESKDGGRSFTIVRGAPGGDDFHFLWINPRDPARRVASSDQGAIVTVNGGQSWSDWNNQPTGQFYHLATDRRFPYWIYSGQQDSGSARIASRSNDGVIGERDWRPVGAEERDFDLPDPEDPSIVFGSGLGGRITRWDERTGERANVSPWPLSGYGKRPTDFRYHYNWFTPIVFSGQPPYALYAGAQVLFRSLDRGAHWEVASPDLSGRAAGEHDCSGSPEGARALACGFGVINAIAPSPRDGAEIWVGTDDGLVWLTRDGARSWARVTPPGVPPWAKVSSIDLPPGRPGTAYVAVDNHRQDDIRPYVYRTTDYGASWTAIGGSLPAGHFVSVVRADPLREGLLYAGTEFGVETSFDDGSHWEALNANLPPVWVHDLLVHERDLVAATNGRAIWVLDDLAPLRQRALAATGAARLYAPSPAYRLRANTYADTPPEPESPFGRNPPTGAIIDYLLPDAAHGPVAIEIRDAAGKLVRRYASDAPDEDLQVAAYFTADWLQRPLRPSAAAGPHRFVWDLRYPRPRAIRYDYSISASYAEGAPLVPGGALALPGEYRVTLVADGRRLDAPLRILADPRLAVTPDSLAAGVGFSRALSHTLGRAVRGYDEIGAVRAALAARRKAVAPPGPVLAARLAALDALVAALVTGDNEAAPNLAAAGDVLAHLASDVDNSDRAPTAAQREVAARSTGRVDTALDHWQQLKSGELATVNRLLVAARLAPLRVPPAGELRRAPPPDDDDQP